MPTATATVVTNTLASLAYPKVATPNPTPPFVAPVPHPQETHANHYYLPPSVPATGQQTPSLKAIQQVTASPGFIGVAVFQTPKFVQPAHCLSLLTTIVQTQPMVGLTSRLEMAVQVLLPIVTLDLHWGQRKLLWWCMGHAIESHLGLTLGS